MIKALGNIGFDEYVKVFEKGMEGGKTFTYKLGDDSDSEATKKKDKKGKSKRKDSSD